MIQKIIDSLSRHFPILKNLNKYIFWLEKFKNLENLEVLDSRYTNLFVNHAGRKASKWAHYLKIYDDEIGDYSKNFYEHNFAARLKFLEIGIDEGGSLEIWRDYLGPNAIIGGVDINPNCAMDDTDFIIRIGSQSDRKFMESVVHDMGGGIDIVLDDGSHIASDQRKTFDILFPLLREGGMYIIEDTHTSYHFLYGGGFRRPGSIVEVAKTMVDGMNLSYFNFPTRKRSRIAHAEILSITFYDSIIVIRKQTRKETGTIISGSKNV